MSEPAPITVEPLTAEGFAPFGDVVTYQGNDFYPINNGMADRYHALAEVETNGDDAKAVISLVKSRRFELPRKLDHMEYHPLGSQAFIPVDKTPFVVVVAEAGEQPDLSRVRAFQTDGSQGINYHPGTWHHVLLTPYAEMDFICVDRDGAGNNCIDFPIPENQQREILIKPA